MKINGKTPGVNRGAITFHRPDGLFKLSVRAVRYGFVEDVERAIPDPVPPVELVRDAAGAVLRDENGMALKTEKTHDADYQFACGRARALRLVLQVREGLSSDPSVTFDTKPALDRACAEGTEREMKEAGFTDSEVVQIFNKVCELNRGGPKRVDEKAEGFLPGGPSASPGGSPPTQDERKNT